MSNFLRVRLQKQPDAWSEGVPLPLAFDSYATKVFCPPWYWNRGPGWLSSQGVLQSKMFDCIDCRSDFAKPGAAVEDETAVCVHDAFSLPMGIKKR